MTAPAYGCQLQGDGESHQVAWLITHLNPAGTISLCDDDFAIGVIHLLATDLGADPERLYDTIKRFTDREQARQAKEADKAASNAADAAGPLDPEPPDETPGIPPQPPMTDEMAGRYLDHLKARQK